MGMKHLERAFSLLIAVLMVTASFIPAVSAIESENNVSGAVVATDDAADVTALTSGIAILFVDDSGGADFTTIRAAVNAARDGDRIVVKAGSYNENVVVNKSVSLVSEAGAGATTVTASSSNSPVFRVDADNVTISGFCISGSTTAGAIDLPYMLAGNCTVVDNVITGNRVGIWCSSSHAVLTGNTITSNSNGGIWLVGARAATVDGNIIDSNEGEGGVYIDCIYDAVIRNNVISNNSQILFLEDYGDDSNVIYLNTFANIVYANTL